MRVIIILCFATLVLSAPAPQGKRQIDFLWQINQDDERPASVQRIESSTVEPKVTASKITRPRDPAPVYEDDEEPADVQEEPRDTGHTASPLNIDQADYDDDSGDNVNGDNSVRNNATNSDMNHENDDQSKSRDEETTERSIIDTTIRVYDEEEVNENAADVEEGKQSKSELIEQNEEEEEEKEEEKEEDKEEEKEEVKEEEEEGKEENKEENKEETDQEQPNTTKQENDKREQVSEINDSYQYDDESLEQLTQERESTTVAPESNPGITATDEGVAIKVAGGTIVVDKDTFAILSEGKPGPGKWYRDPPGFDGSRDYHEPNHYRQHHTVKDDQKPSHGYRGHHDHPFGPPPNGHPFDGPPPPWVLDHQFHHDHAFDPKQQFKFHDESRGYPFHNNKFNRDDDPWISWKTSLSAPEEKST